MNWKMKFEKWQKNKIHPNGNGIHKNDTPKNETYQNDIQPNDDKQNDIEQLQFCNLTILISFVIKNSFWIWNYDFKKSLRIWSRYY